MAKRIIYNEQARRALEKGIDILTESVAVTLGPKAVSYTHLTLPTICSV